MAYFKVWAPYAHQSLAVVSGENQFPLARGERGYWQGEIETLKTGDRYFLSLDGGPLLPDPRSLEQPEGVHGPSRWVDPRTFVWTDVGWQPPALAGGVIYELHVGTFTPRGTFEGAIDQLDALVALGVTHVELLPVAQFPGRRGWGYDGVFPYAPHNAYGGPADLARLVDACHKRGLAVLLDVVYNHLGPDGNYLGHFGPYFTERYRTPWGAAINLDDAGSDEVRRFFIENACYWLRDFHFDGLRLDAVHELYDRSVVHFLEELASAVRDLERELGRPLVLIAESDLNNPRVVTPIPRGGYGFDAQWSDDFHHALHVALTGERSGYYTDYGGLTDLAKALQDGFVYDGRYSESRKRSHGRSMEALERWRLLGYLQNHDQVGNRARGERIHHLISLERAKIGAALLLTAPFTPMLFMGEEWGARSPFLYFADHQNEELARAVSDGRKQEFSAFGWRPEEIPDPHDEAIFQAAKLRWEERGRPEHAAMLDWYRALIRLRRAHPDLQDSGAERVAVQVDAEKGWLVMQRGNLRIATNFSGQEHILSAQGRLLLASRPGVEGRSGGLFLPPDSVGIVEA